MPKRLFCKVSRRLPFLWSSPQLECLLLSRPSPRSSSKTAPVFPACWAMGFILWSLLTVIWNFLCVCVRVYTCIISSLQWELYESGNLAPLVFLRSSCLRKCLPQKIHAIYLEMEIQIQKEMDMEREREHYFTHHTSHFWKSYLMQKKIQVINYHLKKCTMSLAVTIQITYFVTYI